MTRIAPPLSLALEVQESCKPYVVVLSWARARLIWRNKSAVCFCTRQDASSMRKSMHTVSKGSGKHFGEQGEYVVGSGY